VIQGGQKRIENGEDLSEEARCGHDIRHDLLFTDGYDVDPVAHLLVMNLPDNPPRDTTKTGSGSMRGTAFCSPGWP